MRPRCPEEHEANVTKKMLRDDCCTHTLQKGDADRVESGENDAQVEAAPTS